MTAGIAAITVAGSEAELHQLASWLRSEDELRDRVRLSERSVAGDAVVVMVSSRSVATLCRSLFGWLRKGGGDERVQLKLKRSGAVEELDVDWGSGSDVDAVLASVRGFLDQD
ncbi:effector-associated constant component EACC1 [Amycolatopsis sp. NPDC004368]